MQKGTASSEKVGIMSCDGQKLTVRALTIEPGKLVPIIAFPVRRIVEPVLRLRVGLPPRILRRVDEDIDVHLGETIRLDALAEIADLCPSHFLSHVQAIKRRVARRLPSPTARRTYHGVTFWHGPYSCGNRIGRRFFGPEPLLTKLSQTDRYLPKRVSMLKAFISTFP